MAELALVPSTASALAPLDDTSLSLERIKAKMTFQKEMRVLLREYVRSEMDQEHHFYTIPGATKPGLSQDGARMLCTLYNVRTGDPELTEHWYDDGHYQVRVTVPLISLDSGREVARGTGSCSTRESRYAYRWMWPDDVPGSINKASCDTRKRGKGLQYKVPNVDLADTYNTVLKLAEKRAQTAGVMRLPCVPDIFAEPTTEAEDDEAALLADKKDLIKLIVQWTRTLPPGSRAKAFKAVFAGKAYEDINSFSLDVLDTGYGLAEKASAAGIDWKSPTLDADLRKLEEDAGKKAITDLFDTERPQTTARNGTPGAPTAPPPSSSAWRDLLTAHQALATGELAIRVHEALTIPGYSEVEGNNLAMVLADLAAQTKEDA